MQKLTKKDLEVMAKNFNEVLELDPPIITGRTAKMSELEKDINDVVVNHLTKEDKISNEVAKLIKKMQLKPEEVVEEETDLEVVDEVVEETPEEEVVEEVVEETVIEEKVVEKPVKNTTKTKPDSAGKDKKKKTGVDKGKKKYTRAQAFCDALSKNPTTLTEIAQSSIDFYDAANPNQKKQRKIDSVEWEINKGYIQPLVILGFVELKDKKYSLK